MAADDITLMGCSYESSIDAAEVLVAEWLSPLGSTELAALFEDDDATLAQELLTAWDVPDTILVADIEECIADARDNH